MDKKVTAFGREVATLETSGEERSDSVKSSRRERKVSY
jgi:hypothetical protein